MIVVDTSVWIGTLLETDAHYAETLNWLRVWLANDREIHFPMLVLPELAGVLRRRGTPVSVIRDELEVLVSRSFFQLHILDLSGSQLAAEIALTGGIKGADSVFVALATWLGIPLVSWDHQQRERGAMFCRTMTPVEAMEIAE